MKFPISPMKTSSLYHVISTINHRIQTQTKGNGSRELDWVFPSCRNTWLFNFNKESTFMLVDLFVVNIWRMNSLDMHRKPHRFRGFSSHGTDDLRIIFPYDWLVVEPTPLKIFWTWSVGIMIYSQLFLESRKIPNCSSQHRSQYWAFLWYGNGAPIPWVVMTPISL